MINILKKKLSLLIITIFVFFSIQNLSKFNDFGMLEVSDDDELLNLLDDDQNIANSSQNEFYEDQKDTTKKFELTKKLNFSDEVNSQISQNLNIANYTTAEKASDLFIDEKNLD